MARENESNRPPWPLHPDAGVGQISPRRWRRRWIVLAVLIATLFLLHAPLLRVVAGFLIVDEPIERADFVVLLPNTLGSQDARDLAVQLYRDATVRGIVVLAPLPSRAVRYGAWPAPAQLFRAALTAKGISAAVITEISECSTDADTTRRLRELMDEKNATQAIVLCPKFYGRYEQYALRTANRDQPSLHFFLRALPSEFDRDNWWHSRVGFLDVIHQYTKLVFTRIYGETTPCAGKWSYEEFKKSLPAPEADR